MNNIYSNLNSMSQDSIGGIKMVISILGRQFKLRKNTLGSQNVFHLWNMTVERYFIINQLIHDKNFTHDPDLKYLIENCIRHFQQEIKTLENQLDKYSVKGPTPSIAGVNVGGNFEIERDKITAELLHRFLENNTLELITALRSATLNDKIRSIFFKMAKDSLEELDKYVKYLRFKNWLELPPLYPYSSEYINEEISTSEIYHLWDHLLFRYNGIYHTMILSNFARDADLKLILSSGIKFLEKQAKEIEKILLKFGVYLPERYSDVIPATTSTSMIEDKFIFSSVFNGIQNASYIHGVAFRESLVNDKIRSFFKKLLLEEISFIDRLIKYGKLKGWIEVPPTYRIKPKGFHLVSK